MDSFCPTFAAMAAPGFLAHPALCPTTQLCARSSSMIGQKIRTQKSFFQSSIPRNRKLFSASLRTSEEISDKEDEQPLLNPNHAALNPSSFEVQSLLMEICDETNIAELELKMSSFKLRVKRDVTKLKGSTAPAVPVNPAVPGTPIDETLAMAARHPSSALPNGALTPANSTQKQGSASGLSKPAANEELLFVTAPKVGYFRRSRVVKNKTGRPLCFEGQTVKEGQVVCYVEQLGTQQPVETPSAGEVVKILCEEGEPVGYADPLIAIRPSFVGIK